MTRPRAGGDDVCGIGGALRFAPGAADGVAEGVAEIERSLRLVARRGPDDAGVWSDGRHCVLGFRRLAVLDLSSAGHQPLVTPDGRYALVCNGEVYNFRELGMRLAREGVQLHSTGDAEVVLHALALWGVEALRAFNGMFALAFYDVERRRLLLARDHAGMKPLYLRRGRDGVAFGSQYDQLAAHRWLEAGPVDAGSLALYLRFDYIPAPYALHAGTSMVEAGAWIAIDADGGETRGRFHDFPVGRVPDLRGEEACDAVDEAVARAVRRHLVSDVPVGTFLSGGIDSPLVAACAQAT
ncbi:MAG TPA: asparagine synthetase B, partial [Gemmatimonadaceae bacterium]|nr:asparagine synthetase B [Gemmatimonadaceae bacterium]